jgi:hypothetical protein
VQPSFTDPYDSREIGLMTVANPDLDEESWSADSHVVSKCLIIPNCRRFEDPLPEVILKEKAGQDRRAAFMKHFGSSVPTWSTFSLLLPPQRWFH